LAMCRRVVSVVCASVYGQSMVLMLLCVNCLPFFRQFTSDQWLYVLFLVWLIVCCFALRYWSVACPHYVGACTCWLNSLMTWWISAFQVNITSMMTQTLQGKVMASNVLSSFSIRQQMSLSDFEMLQPDNMDQSTSPIRSIIIQKM